MPRITAPISGRVGLRQVDPGNIVHASDANGLVTITQVQPISVIYPMPEDNVPRVVKRAQSGEAIAVDAYDRSGKTKLATGTLLTIDNQIDTTTGTVKLKAEFPNHDGALFPEPVRQHPHGGRNARGRDAGAERRDSARRAGHLRLPRQGGSNGRDRAGQARRAAEGETTEITSGSSRAAWSSSTARTSCATARRLN